MIREKRHKGKKMNVDKNKRKLEKSEHSEKINVSKITAKKSSKKVGRISKYDLLDPTCQYCIYFRERYCFLRYIFARASDKACENYVGLMKLGNGKCESCVYRKVSWHVSICKLKKNTNKLSIIYDPKKEYCSNYKSTEQCFFCKNFEIYFYSKEKKVGFCKFKNKVVPAINGSDVKKCFVRYVK